MVGGGGELVVRYGTLMVGRVMESVWMLLSQKVTCYDQSDKHLEKCAYIAVAVCDDYG